MSCKIRQKIQYTYTVKGNEIIDTFENVNPDEINESLGLTKSIERDSTSVNKNDSIDSIDKNVNGIVTEYFRLVHLAQVGKRR